MKRLIKKSEFYNSFLYKKITYTCYKNPTSEEWENVHIIYKNNEEYKKIDDGIRGMCYPDGNIYICSGTILHSDMIKTLKIPDGLHFEGTNNNIVIIRLSLDMDLEYIKNIFTKCKSLYNYYSKDTEIDFEGNINIGIEKRINLIN